MIHTDELYYTRTGRVMLRECDMYRRLKPMAVLELFQECTEGLTENWDVGLDKMLDNGLIWVAARVGATVHRLPVHNELITVKGWSVRSRAGIFPYRYRITAPDGELLIEGSSMWVLSDLQAHSMLSGNVPVLHLPSPEGEKSPMPKLAAIRPEKEFNTSSRRVLYSECDINGHFTNNRYMDWLSDLADADFHHSHPMTGLRIDYRAECFPYEEIPLEWKVTDERIWCRSPRRFDAMIQFG